MKFDDVDQVRNFVNAVSSVEANFELGSGRRIVDPKSILGVFALDLARPQRLVCDSDDSAMLEKISPYLLHGTACFDGFLEPGSRADQMHYHFHSHMRRYSPGVSPTPK